MSGAGNAGRVRWSRLVDVVVAATAVLLLLATGGGLYYHGQRLEAEQIESHRQLAALDARHNIDFVSQTFHAVELSLRSLLLADMGSAHPEASDPRLQEALRNAPHLRSISLLDTRGQVVASSRVANLGLTVDLRGYLPPAEERKPVLHIGVPHAGRDLVDGQRLPSQTPAGADLGFVPVALGVSEGRNAGFTLLATLNVDFFLNRLLAHDVEALSRVDLLRYDGLPLLSTDERTSPALQEANRALARLWQDDREMGVLMQDIPGEGMMITAYRSDRRLPFAVVTRIDRAHAMTSARDENRRRLLLLMPLVALSGAAMMGAYLVFRRAMLQRMRSQAEQVRQLARLLDALPASVLLFGPDGHTLVVNQAWHDMAHEEGLLPPQRLEDLHYRALADFLHRSEEAGRNAMPLDEGITAVLTGGSEQYQGAFTTQGPHGPRHFRVIVRPFMREGQRCAVLLQLDVTAEQRSAEQLHLHSRVFEVSDEAIVIADARNRIVSVNPAFTRITGYAAEEVRGREPGLWSARARDPEFHRALQDTLRRQGIWKGELLGRRKSGEEYLEQLTITVDRDADGQPRYFVGVFRDVTERKRTEDRLRLLGAALDAAANAVVITDTDAVIQWANPAFSRLSGYAVEEAVGRRPKELVKSGLQSAAFYEALWQTILSERVWRGELVNRRRSGEHYHEALTITPLVDAQGRLTHFIAVKEDISERKRQEEELHRLATTDTLTGVLNRRAFIAQLEQELARCQRSRRPGTLMMLDLDHFKQINDRHGHPGGDAVLIRVCRTLESRLRKTDALGRLGGEEFAILLPETDAASARELAEELRQLVAQQHIDWETGAITVTVSIGVAEFLAEQATAPLLNRADAALYRAKDEGRNRVVLAA